MRIRCARSFVADLGAKRLFKHGNALRLQEKTFCLLELLLRSPRQVVPYHEIEDYLWPDAPVDANRGISDAARKLRHALGSTRDQLKSVPLEGYRLMVDITAEDGTALTTAPQGYEVNAETPLRGAGLRAPERAQEEEIEKQEYGSRELLQEGEESLPTFPLSDAS